MSTLLTEKGEEAPPPTLGALVRAHRDGDYKRDYAQRVGVRHDALLDCEADRPITEEECKKFLAHLNHRGPVILPETREGRVTLKGKKSEVDWELANRFLTHVQAGGTIDGYEDLRAVASPSVMRIKIGRWLRHSEEFRAAYEAACAARAIVFMEQCLTIADTYETTYNDPRTGEVRSVPVSTDRAKLQIEVRKMMAGLYNPKYASLNAKAGQQTNNVQVNFGDALEKMRRRAENRNGDKMQILPPSD